MTMSAGPRQESGERSSDRVREVERHTAALRKELGLPTLVLTQIMFIVGSGWVGTAAKLGTGHVIFWLAAMALFYLPQAAVVIYLNRLMPLEAGSISGRPSASANWWVSSRRGISGRSRFSLSRRSA